MRCPSCGRDVPEGNRFCGNCGAAVEAPQVDREPGTSEESREQEAAEPAPADEAPDQEAPLEALAPTDTTDEKGEREVWAGRYSHRAAAGGLLLTLVIAVGLLVLALLAESTSWRPWLRTAVWIVAAAIVAVVLGRVLWRWARHRLTLRYRLSTERLFIDRGLFSRTRDEIELIRVDDVRVRQGLMDRIFKVGQVRVISTDRTHDDFVLLGIDEPDGVKEKIRQYTRARRKKSLHVESL